MRAAMPLTLAASLLLAAAPSARAADAARAWESLQAGRLDEARRVFEEATREKPESGEAWAGLGEALLGLERFVEAVEPLERALGLGYRPVRTANLIAQVWAFRGDREQTRRSLERWLVLAKKAGAGAYRPGPEFDSVRDDLGIDSLLRELRPCRGPIYAAVRAFVGAWSIPNAPRGRDGVLRFESVEDDCGLLERRRDSAGASLTSLIGYDTDAEEWRSLTIDNRGELLTMRVEVAEGKLVFTSVGDTYPSLRRTLRRSGETMLRDVWEESFDRGASWSVRSDQTCVLRND